MRAPRRRVAPLIGGVVLSILLVGGCAGQRAPSSYTDGVKKAFVTGCTAISTSDKVNVTAADINTYCTCAYGQIKKNVKFSEFKKINDDLTENRGPLPQSFQQAYASCEKPTSGSAGATTTTTKG